MNLSTRWDAARQLFFSLSKKNLPSLESVNPVTLQCFLTCTSACLQPGQEFEKDPCTHCRCTKRRDPKALYNMIICSSIACTRCPVVTITCECEGNRWVFLDILTGLVDRAPSWRVELWVTVKRPWEIKSDFVSAFQGWVNVPQRGSCCGTCKRTGCVMERPGLPIVVLNVSAATFTTLLNNILYLPVNLFSVFNRNLRLLHRPKTSAQNTLVQRRTATSSQLNMSQNVLNSIQKTAFP